MTAAEHRDQFSKMMIRYTTLEHTAINTKSKDHNYNFNSLLTSSMEKGMYWDPEI